MTLIFFFSSFIIILITVSIIITIINNNKVDNNDSYNTKSSIIDLYLNKERLIGRKQKVNNEIIVSHRPYITYKYKNQIVYPQSKEYIERLEIDDITVVSYPTYLKDDIIYIYDNKLEYPSANIYDIEIIVKKEVEQDTYLFELDTALFENDISFISKGKVKTTFLLIPQETKYHQYTAILFLNYLKNKIRYGDQTFSKLIFLYVDNSYYGIYLMIGTQLSGHNLSYAITSDYKINSFDKSKNNIDLFYNFSQRLEYLSFNKIIDDEFNLLLIYIFTNRIFNNINSNSFLITQFDKHHESNLELNNTKVIKDIIIVSNKNDDNFNNKDFNFNNSLINNYFNNEFITNSIIKLIDKQDINYLKQLIKDSRLLFFNYTINDYQYLFNPLVDNNDVLNKNGLEVLNEVDKYIDSFIDSFYEKGV